MPTQPQHAQNSPIPSNNLRVQEPLHSTLNLPTASEDPMPDTVSSGVWQQQQQQIPHEYTGTLNDGSDSENTSPGPMVPGAFGEMSDNGWTGRLYSNWNGTYTHARALAAEAIGDPMLSAWPKYLQLELVVDSEISTLDIQAWIRQTKAPLVRLGYDTNGTDNKCYFDNLVETLRNARGYAIVKWENRGRALERLLIAPLGKALLCAAFPEDGIPNRPMHRVPRPTRTRVIKRREHSRKKERSRRGLSG